MDVLEALKARRSINFFETGESLSDELIKDLLSVANLAPSSFNLQPWKVIVVKEQSRKEALKKCAHGQQKVVDAPAVLIIIADPKGVEENIERVLDSWQELGYMEAGAKENYSKMAGSLYGPEKSEKRSFFAIKNTAFFAMSIMAAAKGFGLDTHPMDGFDEKCVKREFSIPEDKHIPLLLAVGHLKKGVKLLPRSFRRNVSEFTFFDNYGEKG